MQRWWHNVQWAIFNPRVARSHSKNCNLTCTRQTLQGLSFFLCVSALGRISWYLLCFNLFVQAFFLFWMYITILTSLFQMFSDHLMKIRFISWYWCIFHSTMCYQFRVGVFHILVCEFSENQVRRIFFFCSALTMSKSKSLISRKHVSIGLSIKVISPDQAISRETEVDELWV